MHRLRFALGFCEAATGEDMLQSMLAKVRTFFEGDTGVRKVADLLTEHCSNLGTWLLGAATGVSADGRRPSQSTII